MSSSWLILDLSTAALPNAADYLKPAAEREPPGNYKKAESIAAWQADDFADDLARAALDWDLARITGVGWLRKPSRDEVNVVPAIEECHDFHDEEQALIIVSDLIRANETIIGYGMRNFDLPLLMRRARYLGVDFPDINMDRYRSPHIDLCELLSHGDRQKQKPLSFWVKRLGWTDLTKPLSGKEEAQIFHHERWSDLAASLQHDVTATYRLAQWAKVIR